MARAYTPSDPLEPIQGLEAGNSIPVNNQPWFSVGQIVGGVTLKSNYYLKQLLKKKRKHITREILDFLKRGEQLEYSIAGIEAYYALPTNWLCNQCYLQNGQSHSGLTWQYKVLIKGVLDGRSVCVIPDVWIRESCFTPLHEMEFQANTFYKDNRDHIYKCIFQQGEPAFVYVGFIRADGRLSRDNHRSANRLTPWQRRSFQPCQVIAEG